RADGATWRRFLALAAIAAALAVLPAAARAAQGQLYSFGLNYYGELGTTTNNKTETGVASPQPVTLPGADGAVVQVAAGRYSSLVLTAGGQVWGFGENFFGQLGTATNNGVENPPEFPVPNPSPALTVFPGATGPVVQISAGGAAGSAVTSRGQLYSFGVNSSGELGRSVNVGTGAANPTPTLVPLPGASGPVTQVDGGLSHALAVTASGQLFAFGSNAYGELGSTPTARVPTPTLVSLPSATGPVVQAAAGAYFSLALTASGQLYSFGNNVYGTLGRGPSNSSPNPTPALVSLPGATGVPVQISVGTKHALVLTASGQLYSFGENANGQLGRAENAGSFNPNPTPGLVALPGASGPIASVVADGFHSFAITTTGQLFGWGDNQLGQLGSTTNLGSTKPNPTAALVTLPGGARADTAASGFAAHTLVVVAEIAVTTGSLPSGTAGLPYSARLDAAGGTAPLRWSASGLPAGLAIDPGGTISGTPTEPGTFQATVAASDRYGVAASRMLTLAIAPGAPGAPSETGAAATPRALEHAPRLTVLKAARPNVSLGGRLVAGKCVAATAANREKPSCRRRLALPLRLALDAEATVTVELDRLTPGRLVRGLCVRPTDSNRKNRSCSRASAVGKPRAEHLSAAAETLTVTGPALAPGRYEVTVTPYGGGEEGDFRTTRFTVTG
ncbi:MAG: putative Ig domain-containing protein, partial [Solirubrobacterales bacterium]